MFDQPLPSLIQPPYGFRKRGVEVSRSRGVLTTRQALLRSQMKIRLDLLAMSLFESQTLLAHSENFSGVSIMLPRVSPCSPLGRLLKTRRIEGLGARGKSPDFMIALVIGFMTEESQASLLRFLPRRAARPTHYGDLGVETNPSQVRHFADGVPVFFGRFPIIIQEPQSLLADLWKTTGHSDSILACDTLSQIWGINSTTACCNFLISLRSS